MSETKVLKLETNLIGLEDLALGTSSRPQRRGEHSLRIHEIDLPVSVASVEELQQDVSPLQFKYAKIGSVHYRFSSTDYRGIQSPYAQGSWCIEFVEARAVKLADGRSLEEVIAKLEGK